VSTRKVENPNSKGNSAFLWAVLAVLAIAALVIGMIVYKGRAEQTQAKQDEVIDVSGINVEWAGGDSVIRLSGSNADAPVADYYEDFSCSYCAELHVAADAQMIEALKAGEIRVDLRPMTNLDRGEVGHSTTGLAAMLALLATGDYDVAFTLRDYLFVNQQSVYSQIDNNAIADLAADWGASDQAIMDIRDGKFIETAQEMGAENSKHQEELKGKAWTPRVLIDGTDAEELGAPRDQWVETLKNSKSN